MCACVYNVNIGVYLTILSTKKGFIICSLNNVEYEVSYNPENE